mgnify:CR=1 FL=1
MNALPAMLWIIGAAVALLVCVVTVMNSHYRDGRASEVRPVSWTVIGGHVASFVLLAAPYVVYLANSESIGAHARSLYTKLGWASAAVAVAAVGSFRFYPTLTPLSWWWGYGPYALFFFLPCALIGGERLRWTR